MTTQLPEYLTDQTEEAIRQRMLDALPADLDRSEGSYIWDALSPAAIELAQAAIWAQEALRRGFASTTFGSYLDLRCEEHGLSRNAAVAATGQLTFAGPAGLLIPAGTRASTPADANSGTASIEFATTVDLTLDGNGAGTVDAAAVNGGVEGNVLANTITLLSSSIAGVTAVTNAASFSGGLDEESDAALLARYSAKVRNPGTSGNRADYINWALGIPGVGAAEVVPLWNGAGTVKVIVLGADMTPADPSIVADVQAYIDPDGAGNGGGAAPIGAAVTVVAATAVDIAVSAIVVLDGSKTLADVTAAFEQALADYLRGITFSTDPGVKYVRVGSLLLDTAGVKDYSALTINGGTANIAIAQGEVAVKGTVTLSE